MKDSDAEYASKCMAHWRLFIAGPPNRPNKDRSGLLQVIAPAYVHSQQTLISHIVIIVGEAIFERV
jgi:hypothetical protein